jgi:hypothetical protein
MDFLDELDCTAGQTRGMTPLECLRTFPAARAKLLEMVPELVEDIGKKEALSLTTKYIKTFPEKYSNRKTYMIRFHEWLKKGESKGEFLENFRWKNTDPRENYGRFKIVIMRPSGKGRDSWLTGTGTTETKQGYWIMTSFEDYKCIDSNATWDPTWKWILQP